MSSYVLSCFFTCSVPIRMVLYYVLFNALACLQHLICLYMYFKGHSVVHFASHKELRAFGCAQSDKVYSSICIVHSRSVISIRLFTFNGGLFVYR